MTYAESLNQPRHTRIPSTLSNISEDDFVDARSTILNQPQTPTTGTARKRGAQGPQVDGKTMEEIFLENQQLRKHLDKVTHDLHIFQMSAQTSTAALAQSIRLMPRSPLATPETSRTHAKPGPGPGAGKGTGGEGTKEGTGTLGKNFGTEALTGRIAELEEIMKKNETRVRKRDEENAKLRETLVKYRDKWDSLKAGAKARRDGKGRDGAEGGAG